MCLIDYPIIFFGIEGHVALDRNPGPGYDTILLRLMCVDMCVRENVCYYVNNFPRYNVSGFDSNNIIH